MITPADIQKFFSALTFNEEYHKYYVHGKPLKMSVSGIIGKYKYPVDWQAIKERKAEKENKTVEYFTESWKKKADVACELGTVSHKFGEIYPFDRTVVPNSPFEEGIKAFWDELPPHIIPVAMEAQMYHLKYLFGGTADILLYNTKTGNYYLGDYKTNKNLFNNFNGQLMQEPFNFLLCENFSHYTIQLSIYQILIEQILGIKIVGRMLIWTKPDATYEVFETENLTEIIKEELKYQYED